MAVAPVTLTAADGSTILVGGHDETDRSGHITRLHDQRVAAAKRQAFQDETVAAARQALATNATIRANNQTLRSAADDFLGASVPATTAAQLTFLYQTCRSLASGMKQMSAALDALTLEIDGVARLFGVVIPTLADLLDE